MSYNSSKEASCTQTQQSFKNIAGAAIAFILIILIVLGLGIGLPIGLIKDTPHTKFDIVEASIMQFNLTNNTTLYYNFTVTITIKTFRHEMVTHKITAIASYKGNQLATVKMTPFNLDNKNIVTSDPVVFEGNRVMIFELQQLVEYNMETQLEIFNLDLDLNVYTLFSYTHLRCPNLRVPLISNVGKVAPTFNVTKCYKD